MGNYKGMEAVIVFPDRSHVVYLDTNSKPFYQFHLYRTWNDGSRHYKKIRTFSCFLEALKGSEQLIHNGLFY